jgi:hypothetical protein
LMVLIFLYVKKARYMNDLKHFKGKSDVVV